MDLDFYMIGLRAAKQRYGARRVFLATDDAAVIRDAVARFGDEFEFVYTDMNRTALQSDTFIGIDIDIDVCITVTDQTTTNDDTILERRLKKGWIDSSAGDVALDYITDITLLAHCDVLVGAFSSNMDRLAFELMAARVGYVPPFYSLDTPYVVVVVVVVVVAF
jgi:hypothetical protein